MKPNILFLIFDSLRSDKFFEKLNSSNCPNIKSLVNKGVLFPQTISSANATILSWSSLFTSKFPFKTGIRSARFNKLNNDIITSFDILKNNNYNFYGHLPKLSETVGLFPNFTNNDCFFDFYMGLSNGLGEKIIKKINSNLNEPWFFLVHSMDLHPPVQVSDEYDTNEYGKNYYERKISEIDFWIGKIISKIDLNKTIVIITSDHGDYIKSIIKDGHALNFNPDAKSEIVRSKIVSKTPKFLKPLKDKMFFLLESKNQTKKSKVIEDLKLLPHEKRALISGKADRDHFLFDELIKIPLLILGYEIPKNIIINQQVRTVDIFPTLFDLLGFDFDFNVDGKSLLPLLNGKTIQELPAYIESNPLVLSESNDVIGIRTQKFKYFRDNKNKSKRVHLYNLENDPYENTNIASDHLLVASMESALEEICKGFDEQKSENSDESDEIENELRKLGYV